MFFGVERWRRIAGSGSVMFDSEDAAPRELEEVCLGYYKDSAPTALEAG